MPDWTPKDYQAGNFVNHEGSQWKNSEWVSTSIEPGKDARWVRIGEFSCAPLTTSTNKKHKK